MPSTLLRPVPVSTLLLVCLSLAPGCSLPRSTILPSTDMDAGGVLDSGGRDAGALCAPGGCDDGNPCTDDECVPATGCRSTPNTSDCDDGVLCNGGDTCGGGTCSAHDGVDPCPGASTCDAASDTCMGCTGASDCPSPMTGDWSACTFPGDVCATSGTRSRDITSYACVAGACQASTAPESEACSRATDGISCAAPVVGTFGPCEYGSTCAESGTMSRDVTTSSCLSGACTTSTASESMTCTRDTDGTSCDTEATGPFGPCVATGTCSTSGNETRTLTTPTCASGACNPVVTMETRACTLPPTDGTACGTPVCGAYGACMPDTMATCETRGTQVRTCTTALCGGGSCSGSSGPVMEMQACTVPAGGACTSRLCGACFEVGMTRCRSGHSGVRSCAVTMGTCSSGGNCLGSITTVNDPCDCPP